MMAVEGVKDWECLASCLSLYSGISVKDAVQWFLRGAGHFKPSWRAIIFALDGAGETHLANGIRSYGEPVQGVCVCVCVCVLSLKKGLREEKRTAAKKGMFLTQSA